MTAEHTLIARARSGDREAQQELIERVLPGLNKLARSLASERLGMTQDDLVQEGVIGAIHAIRRFDPSRGAKFFSYVYTCAWGRMRDAWRQGRLIRLKRGQRSQFTAPCQWDDKYELHGPDTVHSQADRRHVLELCQGEDRALYEMRAAGYTFQEISKQCGYSQSRWVLRMRELTERVRRAA